MALELPELLVANAAAWRAWLGEHHDESTGVWLVLAKKGTVEPTSLTYDQALEQALCHGWIDGQVRRRDETTYRQRFTRRRPRSAWSKRNIEIAERLLSEGRERKQMADRRPPTPVRPASSCRPTLAGALAAEPKAQAMFDILTSQNRYALLYRIQTAKRADTRTRRIKRYVTMLARDETIYPQKRVPEPHPDWLDTVHIKFPSGRSADFLVVEDAAGLAWIANLGCIELHTWHSRVDDIERPDYLLIDLDPSEGNPWSHVREIALVVKEVMDELGLTSFPKTSGATGLHILAPIKPELEFPKVRDFAKALAKEVERRIDDQDVATTTWKVADRRGVFVDYGQNARDRTIASAYSIRPTPDARASAPLTWEEVPRCDPAKFTLSTMRKRIDAVGDLTAGMWRRKVSLSSRLDAFD